MAGFRFTPYVAAAMALLGGCAFMAEQAAPAKQASATRTETAQRADTLFWNTFHSGDYDGISKAMEAVKGAYLGGKSVEWTGNYDWMWWADIVLAVGAALAHLPIDEKKKPALAAAQPA